MKKQLIVTVSFFISIVGFSQGIIFEHGTLNEVLEKAKISNKPVFIDVYTSWCAPCKKMSNEVFPLAEVGKEYNSNFVCCQIDAERGDGILVANKYNVVSFPTYLFIKPDGTLFSRSGGMMSAENLLAVSKTAKADMYDPKPLPEWEKEYTTKKNDPGFMLGYINKQLKLGMSVTRHFDDYLALLPSDQRASNEIIGIYQKENANLKVNTLAFANLENNRMLFLPKLSGYIYIMMFNAVDNSFREACKSKNEQLLQKVIETNEKMPRTSQRKIKEELYMNYYKQTNDLDKYISNATIYCNTSLMTVRLDSIEKMDKKIFETAEIQRKTLIGRIDSTQLALLTNGIKHIVRNKYSEALNGVAWDFFVRVSDIIALQNALRWTEYSQEIYPNNPMFIDTYANLLYKLGRNKEAIDNEAKAFDIAKRTKMETKGFETTLQKMKYGLKTW